MKVFDIIKKVGGGIIKQVFPAAGAVVDVVNAFLPDDNKLPEDATGTQMQEAIEKLPHDLQEIVLTKQIDLEIEEIKNFTEIMRVLNQSDSSGSSTRPKIALMMAWLIVYGVVIGITAFGFALYEHKVTIENSWPLMLTILGTPTTLLLQYFGKRTKEKIMRYAKAPGNQLPIGISSLFDFFKK